MKKKGFSKKVPQERAKEIADLVHVDILGPLTPSIGGSKYFIAFTDDKSRFHWGSVIKKKSDAVNVLQAVFARIKTETGKKIKEINCDQAAEFIKGNFADFCRTKGIKFKTHPPYSPELTGVAERFFAPPPRSLDV